VTERGKLELPAGEGEEPGLLDRVSEHGRPGGLKPATWRPQPFPTTKSRCYDGQHRCQRQIEGRVRLAAARSGKPQLFRWPQLIAVHDLASATAAINEITEQAKTCGESWMAALQPVPGHLGGVRAAHRSPPGRTPRLWVPSAQEGAGGGS
jgi:hypothetical protein